MFISEQLKSDLKKQVKQLKAEKRRLKSNNTSSTTGSSLVSSKAFLKMAKQPFSLFVTRADLDELVLPNNSNGPSTVKKKLVMIYYLLLKILK